MVGPHLYQFRYSLGFICVCSLRTSGFSCHSYNRAVFKPAHYKNTQNTTKYVRHVRFAKCLLNSSEGPLSCCGIPGVLQSLVHSLGHLINGTLSFVAWQKICFVEDDQHA